MMLYTFGAVLGLINSLSRYYRAAHTEFDAMSSLMNGVDSLQRAFEDSDTLDVQDPMEHIEQCIGEQCVAQRELRDTECTELLNLIAENPSYSVLQTTYDSLHCSQIEE